MKYKSILYLLFFCIKIIAQPVEGTLLGHWEDTSIIGSSHYDNKYNEIWGISRGGKEYAIIGSTQGTHFIDVTNPKKPTEAFFIEGASHGSHIVHRDYHDYGCYLYAVAGEGSSSTLQIIDLSQLPNTVSVVYDSQELFYVTHNMFIDSSAARLYTFAETSNKTFSAMSVYDLSDPVNPKYINSYNNFAGLNASHVHDGFIQNNIAYLNLGGAGLAIMDYTDPFNPIALGTLTSYADRGYNHSGWATPDNKYYYMADENWGFDLKAVDVTDPSDIKVGKLFDADATSPKSIAHNQVLACNYLYVSYYFDGLQVYDVSDPLNPKRVLYYDTYSGETIKDYKGAWGVFPFLPSGNILVSDMQTGLYIVEGFQDGCNSKQSTVCPIVSTDDWNRDITSFSTSPNPTSDYVTINLDFEFTEIDNLEIILTDINGRIVLKQNHPVSNNNNWIIDINNLANGFYMLNVKAKNIFLSEKIIVAK